MKTDLTKEVYPPSLFRVRNKFYSTILTVGIFVLLLCLIVAAVCWTYQLVQPEATKNEKVSTETKKDTVPAPMIFFPMISNEISGNTNDVAKSKKAVKHRKQEENLIYKCSPCHLK